MVRYILTPSDLDRLVPGINFIKKDDLRFIIFKDGESMIVSKNHCKHNGGIFMQDIEEVNTVRCTRHGWKLNAKTLEYTSPPSCLTQQRLETCRQADGSVEILIDQRIEWLTPTKETLLPGELTITYLSHACVEIKAGTFRLITDPWILGPAFSRGWWSLHEPPLNSIQRIASADAIYISHSHPDHLNMPTLYEVFKLNPDIRIYVGNLSTPVFKNDFLKIGFTNITVVGLKTWIHPADSVHFMIVADTLVPNLDTYLLFEYKGHRIVNLVDCCNPEDLPASCDVLLNDFASGASAYPCLYEELYGKERVIELVNSKRRSFLLKIKKHIDKLNPSVWIPFAGYFTEACNGDDDVRSLNIKNTPEEAIEFIEKKAWKPFPGGTYDIGLGVGEISDGDYYKTSWQFEPYLSQLSRSLEFGEVGALDGLQAYYDWAGFSSYNLGLHMIETTDDYKTVLHEYYVMFGGDRPIVSYFPPDAGIPILRMRSRASVLRDIYIRGYSWDNLMIGFNTRIWLSPDIFHYKFVHHFCHSLPETPPRWNSPVPPSILDVISNL